MILFSDAVFAIAITLLVIEIKVPELDPADLSETAILSAMAHLVPRFIGFIISFALIGMYWTRHHTLFGHVVALTPQLLTLNLLFLFTIVLMPFSTGIFGEFSTPRTLHLKTPLVVYVANIAFSGIMLFRLWGYVGNRKNGVGDPDLDPDVVRRARTRAAVIPAVFMLAIPVAFINPYAARYVPLLIPLVVRVVNRRVGRSSAT
jgi:uncharacterized membrane protein